MRKEILLTVLICLLLSVGNASAFGTVFTTEQVNRMLVETVISLGNSTCNSMECNSVQMNFLVPKGLDSSKFKLSFDGVCISGGANATENYYLNVWCDDGSTNVIDLSLSDCESLLYNELPSLWINISNVTPQQFYGDITYMNFFCLFSRNTTNTERIPTEFKVTLDSLGLSTQSEDTNIVEQRSAITSVAQSIGSLVSINLQVWQIIFNIFEVAVLLMAFIGIPILLIMIVRWGINKVKSL